MALVKCGECGHDVSDSAAFCPNCGCPFAVKGHSESIANNLASDVNDKQIHYCRLVNDIPTTDTEYKYEEAIHTYAKIVFWITVAINILLFVFSLFAASKIPEEGVSLAVLCVGMIFIPLNILLAYVSRAYAAVYANMSVNLHEINMKLQ